MTFASSITFFLSHTAQSRKFLCETFSVVWFVSYDIEHSWSDSLAIEMVHTKSVTRNLQNAQLNGSHRVDLSPKTVNHSTLVEFFQEKKNGKKRHISPDLHSWHSSRSMGRTSGHIKKKENSSYPSFLFVSQSEGFASNWKPLPQAISIPMGAKLMANVCI